MRPILLALVTTALGAAPLAAQTAQTESPAADRAAADTGTAYLGASAAARAGKSANVALGMGYVVGSVPGGGLTGSYFLSPDLRLGVTYYAGQLDLSSEVDDLKDTDDVDVDKAMLKASLALLDLRYFVGNSFNIGVGLGQRRITGDIDVQSKVIDAGITSKITANTTVLSVTVGNEWAWDSGFTLGCDWIGYAASLASSSSSDTDATGSMPPDEDLEKLADDADDAAKEIGKTGSLMLLLLHVGWSF